MLKKIVFFNKYTKIVWLRKASIENLKRIFTIRRASKIPQLMTYLLCYLLLYGESQFPETKRKLKNSVKNLNLQPSTFVRVIMIKDLNILKQQGCIYVIYFIINIITGSKSPFFQIWYFANSIFFFFFRNASVMNTRVSISRIIFFGKLLSTIESLCMTYCVWK